MANEKVKNVEVQKVDTKKVEAKVVKIATIAKAWEVVGLEGTCKNRDEAATKIVALLNKNGVTKTKNGILTVERVRKQMNNMLYAIAKLEMKRWKPFKLVETETECKLVKN